MKLFAVTYSGVVLLAADSIDEARKVARRCITDEIRWGGEMQIDDPEQLTKPEQVPHGWRDALVWNCDDDKTPAQVMASGVSGEGGRP